MSSTWRPRAAAVSAHISPAAPAPTITTSAARTERPRAEWIPRSVTAAQDTAATIFGDHRMRGLPQTKRRRMKLIGAGLPRTATTTQMIALEMLGLPSYHMRDMMADMSTSVPQYRQALEGNGDWDEIFDGKESTVDWPASYHWRELMDVYPDAKVLLSVRSAESWVA